MRYLHSVTVLLALSFFLSPLQAQTPHPLEGIQGKIEMLLGQCFQRQSAAPLDSLKQVLSTEKLAKSTLASYWRAYLGYYRSIYYLKSRNREASEEAINATIKSLKQLDNKSTEDYALLAACQGLATAFAQGMGAGMLSQESSKNAEQALALDSTNVRAWYILGSNDFYTPEQWGGGKKAEGFLLKAVSLPAQSVPNPYMPSWGRQDALGMLIALYLRRENYAEAKRWLDVTEKEFPNAYFLADYKKQLESK